VTSFGNTTKERVSGGLTDWELSINGFFTEGSNSIDETLSSLLSKDTVIMFGASGSASGATRFSGSALLSDYSIEFPIDGAATISAKFSARTGSLTKDTW
jgi:phosphoheptose isomerase